MAKLSYHLASETTLVLDQDGQKGDTIDLKDEQKVDTESLSQALQASFEEKLQSEKAAWQKNQEELLEARLAKEKQSAELTLEQARAAESKKAAEEQTKLQEELAELKAQLKSQEEQGTSKQELALAKQKEELAASYQKEKEALQAKLAAQKDESGKQQQSLEQQVFELNSKLQNQDRDKELALVKTRAEFEAQLKAAEEQVEFYKDFKARQSTKEIGESLEVYAHQEFNKFRAMAFPNAYFEKDNEVSKQSGSKGDFIFRDYEDGIEFISIMFDMKNEADSTEKKHKNEDFFKELDKDRREKGTEYAVLVSMLEADDEFYNTGIVQVPNYEKMYVIRPQFFIHFIGLLRNAALDSVQYKKQLLEERNQNIDITNFEQNINDFKNRFAKNYESYSKNFAAAIEQIDKSIKRMEDVKKYLTTSENQLRLANNKLDDVSVKKLTRGNKTMQEKFAALDAED